VTKLIQNGGFQNPAGGALTGNLLLMLSQDAKVATNPNQIAPLNVRIPISGGNVAPTLIYFNDELLPNNTYYTATAYDSAGNKVYGPEIWSLTGAGPLDLGTLTPLLISPDPLFSNPVLQNPSAPQTITGQSLTLASSAQLIAQGGGSLQGTWTGGPSATISVTESGATVTATVTAGSCVYATNQVVLVSGFTGVNTPYNSPGGPGGVQGWVVTSGCGGGSTFQWFNPITGLGAASGGTVVASPLFTGNLSSSFLTTGTGGPTLNANVAPINREERCGSFANPITLSPLDANAERFPCGHVSEFFGAGILGVGYSQTVHRMDGATTAGYDNQNTSGGAQYMISNGTNSGGSTTDNATAVEGAVLVAKANSSASAYGTTNIGQCLNYAGLGPRVCQGEQNLVLSNRGPVFQGDTTGDYTPISTNVIMGGSQNVTAFRGTSSSAAGKGALIGDFLGDAINVAHVVPHGFSIGKPDTAYWAGSATTQYHFLGAGLKWPLSQGQQPLYSDSPTWGLVHGEKGPNAAQSNVLAFFATNAGTACTLLAAPSGATQVGNVATYTCNAAISGDFAVGSIAHITGVGQSGYNIDCVITSVASPSFTCNNSNIVTPPFTITGLSESGSTVTVTTSATCPFTTGENVTIANGVNANPTTNNAYNGTFVVLTPGCNGGSTFTYTNTVTGLPTCASQGACVQTLNPAVAAATVIGNPLPASGGGTVLASTRLAATDFLNTNNLRVFGFASPPNGNGTDVFDFNGTTAAFHANSPDTTNILTFQAPNGAGQIGTVNSKRLDFLIANAVTWSLSTTGVLGPLTDGGFDLGATATLRPNNGFFKNVVTAAAGFASSTFANLPAAANGVIYGCSDCTAGSNPCTGASTGALAVRQNAVWVCK
jgi:hypothetical protein